MENISYFCIVEKIKRIYIALTLLILCHCLTFANNGSVAIKKNNNSAKRISLLTCQPGDEVYSIYGHTAIRYQDTEQSIDIAINYGMFSFNKPHFITRFILGLTDYEMGIIPFDRFLQEYNFTRRRIFEQELNLSTEDKERFIKAVEKNYLPENRTYRYNYLYDNCTTRARDIIEQAIGNNRQIKYAEDEKGETRMSYRDFIHLYNEHHPWARFGNDLLLGLKADMPISYRQEQFLPKNLKDDFQEATITGTGKGEQPLVKRSGWINGPFKKTVDFSLTPRPIHCAFALLIISVISVIIEIKTRKAMWGLDLIYMLTTGLAGIIIFVMLFSQHPTTTLNLQILILNPLSLFFVYRTAQRSRKRMKDKYWIYASVCLAVFLTGGLIQCYAEGMCILALALLTRCLSNIYNRQIV